MHRLTPRHLVRLIALVLITTAIVLPTQAQDDTQFDPVSGPPGTVITLEDRDYGPRCQLVSGSGEFIFTYTAPVVQGSNGPQITVPGDTFFNRTYAVECFQAGSDAILFMGEFTVTEPRCPIDLTTPLARTSTRSIVPLARASTTGISFRGENLSRDSTGTYFASADFFNALGQNLRVVVSGSEPSELLDYLNEVNLTFEAVPAPQGSMALCTPDNVRATTTPDSTATQADITIDMALMTSGVASRQQYVVYYLIDPQIGENRSHNYRTEGDTVVAASAQVRASNGVVKMTMWSDPKDYVNAVVDSAEDNVSAPSLRHNASPDRARYSALIVGARSRNVYEIRGAFATQPCSNCGDVDAPPVVLLDGGNGLTTGEPMDDGNFQVEGYCGIGDMSGFPIADNDDDDWYCENEQGGERRLDKFDFDEICRLTYDDSLAFAVQNTDDRIDAYNWRCYGVQN